MPADSDDPLVLPDDSGEVVEGEPVADNLPAHRRISLSRSQYISSLPSPDDIDRYSVHEPAVLRWLMDASDREQAHRHQIEDRLVRLDEGAMPRFYQSQGGGRKVALALGVGYELVMALAIAMGHTGWGIGGAAAGVGGIVWAVRRDPGGPPDSSGAGISSQDDEGPAQPGS